MFKQKFLLNNDLIPHIFFLTMGLALFGEILAVPGLLILIYWLGSAFSERIKGLYLELKKNKGLRWIFIFSIVLLLICIISDFYTGGRIWRKDGSLMVFYWMIFIFSGIFIALEFGDKLARYASFWVVFWTLLIVGITICDYFYPQGYFASLCRHGFFSNINIFSSAMISLLLSVVNITIISKKRFKWLLMLGVMLFSFFFMAFISSSQAVPAVFLCIFMFSLLFTNSEGVFSIVAVCFSVMGVGILMSCYVSDGPLIDLSKWSFWANFFNHREVVWTVSMEVLRENPLWGVGGGNFETVYKDVLPLLRSIEHHNIYIHSHNIILHMAASHGIFAACALIGLIFCITKQIIRNLCKKDYLTFILFPAFLMWLIYGVVEFAPSFEELIPLIWGSVGIIVGRGISGQKNVN